MAKNKATGKESSSPRLMVNRRARYDYEFIHLYEAGIALAGSEVKSVFLGRVNMTDAYAKIQNGELWLVNLDIEPYANAGPWQLERRRERKLLMHRKEIDLLQRRSQEKGFAIVPSRIYFNHGKVKVEIALARGKRQYDKREQIAQADQRREVERARGMRR